MTTTRDLCLSIEQLVRFILGKEERREAIEIEEVDDLDALVDTLDTLDPATIEKLMEATGGGIAASRNFAASLPNLMDQKKEVTCDGPVLIASDAGKPRQVLESCDLFVKEFGFFREVFNCVSSDTDGCTASVIATTGDCPVILYVKSKSAAHESGWTVISGRDWNNGMACDGFSHLPAVKQMERRKLGFDID